MGKSRYEEMKEKLLDHRNGPSKREEFMGRLERGNDSLIRTHFNRYGKEMSEVWGECSALGARKVEPAVSFRTGMPTLDHSLGGGIPSGAVEIYGEESVGKTTLLMHMVGAAQRQGLETALCMSEFFDAPRFVDSGVSLDKLLFMKGNGEMVLGSALNFITSKDRRVLFIDSMTGLRPSEDEFDDWVHMVLEWMRGVMPGVGLRSSVVMTNQVRAKVSKEPGKMFAGGVSSTARRVAGLFDTRLELSRDAVSEETYELVVNVVANTLDRPARIITLPVIKSRGVDVWRDLVRCGVATGALSMRGTWYLIGVYTLGQGEVRVAKVLESDPRLARYVEESVYQALRLPPPPSV